jgi:hypothetical protein
MMVMIQVVVVLMVCAAGMTLKTRYHCQRLGTNLYGKGFGAQDQRSHGGFLEGLKSSRSGQYRSLSGDYGKVVARNLESFEMMKKRGIPVARDLYVRLSTNNVFWFVGKIIHDSRQIDTLGALLVMSPLIKEYGKTLRPKDIALGTVADNANIQIWTAPGNSEMDSAQHKTTLERLQYEGVELDGLSESVSRDSVGFEPEIYVSGEEGFRIHRDEQGKPIRAPIEVNVKSQREMGLME